LIAALADSYELVRRNAAEALGKLGDLRALDPLMKALGRSYAQAHSYESSAIAQALATLGKTANSSMLTEVKESTADLASDNPNIRREAARRLGELSEARLAEEALAVALWDQDQLVRWGVTKALGTLWQIQALVDLGNANNRIRRNSARSLRGMQDTRIVEPLLVALQDQDRIVRKIAMESLGTLGDIPISRLVSLLRHKDKEIRQGAGRALAAIGGNRTSTVLANALLWDHRPWVRESAADALVKLGDQALPVLAEALRHDDPGIQQLARTALRRIGTVRAQGVLRFGSDN